MREVTAEVFDHFIYNYKGELSHDILGDVDLPQLVYTDISLPLVEQVQAVVCYYDDKNLYYVND